MQAEALADRLLQIPPVREVEQANVVDEHDHGWALRSCLGGISKPEAPALEARGWMLHESLAQHLVELVGRHLDAALAHDLEGCRDDGADALFGLRRYGDDGRIRGELEAPRQDGSPVRRFPLSRF